MDYASIGMTDKGIAGEKAGKQVVYQSIPAGSKSAGRQLTANGELPLGESSKNQMVAGIPLAFELLDTQVNDLEKIVLALFEKLQPVMSDQSLPKAEGVVAEMDAGSPVARAVVSVTNRLWALNESIDEMYRRIEL